MNIWGRSRAERAAAEARRQERELKKKAKEQAEGAEKERRRMRQFHETQEQLTRANQIYERLTTENAHYANVIILLGYGGFFALWSSLADKMPRGLFGAAGGIMGISLLLFLSFEIVKIGLCSWAANRADTLGMNEQMTLGHINATLNKVNRWWLLFFGPAVIAGLAAGGIVLWAYWTNAMQGSWTT